METINLLSVFGCLCVQKIWASNCYQEMNYEKLYGYKYDINCNYLNDTNIEELQEIIVKTKVKLTITNSNLSNITSKFFKNIINTKELIINSSAIPLSGKLFTHLDRLDVLILNNNSMEELPQGFFDGPQNLRVLKLSYNGLGRLPNNTFTEIHLQELDLSHNRFVDLSLPCELQQLTYLDLSHNQIANLRNLSPPCTPLLKVLDLSHNRLVDLNPLRELRYLQKIDLSHNLLEDIGDGVTDLENLKQVNLAGNLLRNVNFRNSSSITVLNLANNSLTGIDSSNLVLLEELNLEMNQLTEIPPSLSDALKKIDLSHNPLAFNRELRRFPNLVNLRLSDCGIGKLERQLDGLDSLEVLDLSRNLVDLREASLKLGRLNVLDLSANSLRSLLVLELKSLVRLNLSWNSLEGLEGEVFVGCPRIAVLDLSHNHLESLDDSVLRPLEGLSEVHLEYNRLAYLAYGGILAVHKSLRFLGIGDNRFSCQFLSSMVYHFGVNNIEFGETANDYSENVAGIHCHEVRSVDSDTRSENLTISDTLIFVIASVILGLLAVIVLVLYKISVFVRRRANIDEVELIDRRFKLRNYL
ncbi:hypothetical protein PPYR_14357 [Photinus pyralis]|uniref:LRRCT domain-containing protein n=1 Tax=Photinus pyralis TaxID=7054 RepID=A0A5N4A534_PHOPY|nr:chaoptin-like [Photinus pyralis]KAB0792398.1 hypothetical protein PPYR_14357 [Photinus pyralis]